ncbi:MAG TPA: CapA family protein [Gammaproteobacteria bacterium]
MTLLLLGDFNVQQREHPADALQLVRQTLNEADLVYANLEGLLVESKGPAWDLPNKNGWTHLGPEAVEALVAGNISVVGVANNVAYGRDNIMASLSVLDAHGIAHTGAGKDIDAAHEPAIVEKNGVTFGFLQYTSKWYDEAEQIATEDAAGVARLKSPDGTTIDPGDLDRLLDDIRRTRPKVDVLVVSAHTRDGQGRDGASRDNRTRNAATAAGAASATTATSAATDDLYSRLPVNENLQYFEPYQRRLAQAAIDAGADIVFGHGCHSLQAVETYAGKPVMYCLGNFASDWIRVRDYRDGLVARVVIEDKRVKRVSLVPVTRDAETNNVWLVPPDSPEGERLYGKLRELSGSTDLKLDGQELVLLEQ